MYLKGDTLREYKLAKEGERNERMVGETKHIEWKAYRENNGRVKMLAPTYF